MCGIAGVWARADRKAVGTMVQAMNDAMTYRGPDDEGVHVLAVGEFHLGLGARRLAIQDLSPAGHQPMADSTTGNWIVFNGEIFNFLDLRRDLESCGFAFRSRSDTEV